MNETTRLPDEGPYEFVTKKKTTRTVWLWRASLIAGYALFAAVFLYIGLFAGLLVPFLCTCPVLIFALWFFTWRLTQVEYEFSLFAEELSVTRILGHRSAHLICTLPVRGIERIVSVGSDDCESRVYRFCAERTVFAGSHEDSPTLFAVLARDEDGTRTVLWLEATEPLLRRIRRANPTAVPADTLSRAGQP